MSEKQEKYDLGATIEGFNSLGEAVRYFRQKNDNLTISSICKFMEWQHSYLMDVEFGREILTDINTIKKLAEALEIHSSMLLKLTNINQKPFIYEYELDNFRPKLLNEYEQLKKEVNLCSTPKCCNNCSSCKHKVPLLQLMDYINQLEIIVNYNPNKIENKPFNPSDFGKVDGSFNGSIYRSFDGKLTFKESNGLWVILANNGAKIPLVVFRGVIESNADAEIVFKSVGKVKDDK